MIFIQCWNCKSSWIYGLISVFEMPPGPRFNIKMSSYQNRKSHCGDKMIFRPSYLHNGISYTGKMSSLYWIGALVSIWHQAFTLSNVDQDLWYHHGITRQKWVESYGKMTVIFKENVEIITSYLYCYIWGQILYSCAISNSRNVIKNANIYS